MSVTASLLEQLKETALPAEPPEGYAYPEVIGRAIGQANPIKYLSHLATAGKVRRVLVKPPQTKALFAYSLEDLLRARREGA